MVSAPVELERHLQGLRGLLVATRLWARGDPLDARALAATQDEALLRLHRLHLARIPVYRDFATAAGLTRVDDAAQLAGELMVTDGLFKSYDADWLDRRDFAAMTSWLGTLFIREPAIDPRGIEDVGAWRARLREDGTYLTFSSGTSGRPSFVPRDRATLTALRRNGLLSAVAGTPTADALLLTAGGIGLGIQSVARGLLERAAHTHHLGAPALAETPGPDGERAWEDGLRFVAAAAGAGRSLTVLGTPAAVEQLCERALERPVRLSSRSTVVTGGGWKGARTKEPAHLDTLVRRALGNTDLMDVYGAAELNCYLVRCRHGRYHVPPLVRTVVLDDLLVPLQGGDGLLGFLDPFALSYPGFVIPGDVGRLVDGTCACGLSGPAVEGPIERAPTYAARGCAA